MSLPFSLGWEHPEQGIEPVHHLYIPWQRIWNIIDKIIKLRTILWNISRLPNTHTRASQVALVKNPPANAVDIRDAGSIPESGRSPGGEHGNPLWYSCLENPMDRGAWGATVHRVAKSGTWMKRLSTHTHTHTHTYTDRQDIPPLLLQERKNKHSY